MASNSALDSAVENHGNGPLRVDGRRLAGQRDDRGPALSGAPTARSLAFAGSAPCFTRAPAGTTHWPYLLFDRYELRRAYDHRLVRPDRKTGFCLGDRYGSGRSFPAKPTRAVITGSCRLDNPGARSVAMGISVGYGDDYHAYLEGQSIEVTGLPAGRYELVHRVNGTDGCARPATPTTRPRCWSG